MRKIISLLAVSFIFLHAFAQTETPLIGATKTIDTAICRIDAGWNERSNINNVYTPPKGWQVLTCEPIVVSKSNVLFTFSKTPSNFTYTSPSAIYSKFIELLELAAEKNVFQKYEAVINEMRNDFDKYINKAVPVYAAITTTGSVSGTNQPKMKKGGRLYLDLKITIVYMPGSEEQCLQSLEALKQLIHTEGSHT